MPFDPALAAIRFGTGLSPVVPPPGSAEAMLAALAGPDAAALRWPVPLFSGAAPSVAAMRALNRTRREAAGTAEGRAAEDALAAARESAREVWRAAFVASLSRAAFAEDGLRERLVRFWADHFTLRSKNSFTTHLVTPYVEEAIRPRITGRFADLLWSAVVHPMMLDYLDQSRSVGPASPQGERSGRGLNENFARELLELHSLGVTGPYDQVDVRELAELLTGLFWDLDAGLDYRPGMAEPGAETVLGVTYPAEARIATVRAALDDLAAHPATARHVATKLATHFVADDPPPALVGALESAFQDSGGDLMAVTGVLLGHPASWDAPLAKVRPPFDLVAAALRALAVPEAALSALDLRGVRRHLLTPLATMGQPWEAPPDPDGWPDLAEAWVQPQFVAARIDWAMRVPSALLPDLPDPRDFAGAALGPFLPEAAAFAAAAAEDRRTGIALVLASPAFQRR